MAVADPRRRRATRLPHYESPAFRSLIARFTSNLRRLRAARGWTQEQAGEHCGLAMQQYQRTESGSVNLTFTTLARIAEGFGVDVAELFAPADVSLTADPASSRQKP